MNDQLDIKEPPQAQSQPAAAFEPASRRRRGSGDPSNAGTSPGMTADILAGTPYEGLPECFVDHRDGMVVQEREPCYYIQASTALGEGRSVTNYEEGCTIVTTETPNETMQPLNRAAAIRVVTWRAGLPPSASRIDIGDMAEAAQMLGSDPDMLKLPQTQWQMEVVKLANELRERREGRPNLVLPGIAHNFTSKVQPSAPPLLNSRLAEMAERYPGQTRFANAVPVHSPPPQTRRVTPAPMSASPMSSSSGR